jgi:hypothetical protein
MPYTWILSKGDSKVLNHYGVVDKEIINVKKQKNREVKKMEETVDRVGFAMEGSNMVILAERGNELTRIVLKPEDAARAAFQMISMLQEAAVNFHIINEVVDGYQ